jgi:hypothetical protein
MSTPWHDLLADTAIRINALIGTAAGALETTFLVRPLTSANFQSTVFSFTDVKYALINAEEKLAHAIASTSGHPWRATPVFAGVTASIANEAALPAVSSIGAGQIIGELGSVHDATDGTVCTEKPLAVIRRRVRNAASFPTGSNIYHYHIDGNRIYHTRTNVVIDVCVYNRATQLAALTGNADILLPDVLGEAYVCGAVSYLVRDDEFTGQAELYRAYFNDTLSMIRGGFTEVPAKPKLAA